jgi:hypothetical protein
LLYQQKLLTVEPTGYFGVLTRRAVATYQAKNSITPAVGYFGPITLKRMMDTWVCNPSVGNPVPQPDPTNGVIITAPRGDVSWAQSSIQKISWTDSKVYIQAPKYDVKVQSDTCEPNQPCALIYHIPVTIAKNISDTQFSWNVGSRYMIYSPTAAPATPLTTGKYRIYVCPTGLDEADLSGCAKSAGRVTTLEVPVSDPGTGTTTSSRPLVTVTTDKTTYASNETIKITLTAKNTSTGVQKIGFTSCQTNYKIGEVYNDIAAKLCLQALTEVSLQPGETKSWALEHNLVDHPIPKGTYKLEGELMNNNGTSTTQITIQ